MTRPRTRSAAARGVTFDDVRAMAMALEGVEESTSYGTPAFKVRGKLLARLREDGETLVVRADMDARDMLVASDPEAFFFTDHYAAYRAVLVRLPRVARGALAVLLEEAHRTEAPKKRAARAAPVPAEPAPAKPARKAPAPVKKASAATPVTKGGTPAPPAKVEAALERLRALCRDWPGVTEVTKHGRPCFAVRGKTFVMFMDNHHGDGRLALWCKAPPGAQGTLIEADAKRFFVPPYVGVQGWVGVRLDAGGAWGPIASCVEEGHRMTAAPATKRRR